MKKVLFAIVAILSMSMLQAQVKEGTIVYERKVNNHRMFTNEQMKAMIPEYRISKHILMFSDKVSLYRMLPENEAPDPFASGAGAGGGGSRMVFSVSGGNDGGELYKDFIQSKSILSSELSGKNYLIVDSIKQQPWKLINETKEILGYTCLKATRKVTIQGSSQRVSFGAGSGGANITKDTTSKPQSREIEVVAWYAQDIASPVGPDSYGQLPGVILQLDSDNGATVFTAIEVKKQVDPKQLKEPKKGKVVTNTEFSKLRNDMLQQQFQGGGRSFQIGGQ